MPTARKGPSGDGWPSIDSPASEPRSASKDAHRRRYARRRHCCSDRTGGRAPFGIVMRQPVGQDRAARARPSVISVDAANLRAGKQHQRIGRHRHESVLADLDAGGLCDGALVSPVHDGRCLGGHVRRGVRPGDDRERNVVAAIKAAGCRLQIERGDLRARRDRDRTAAWHGKGRARAGGRARFVRRRG